MTPDLGIHTSALLQTLKERGCQVSYPTFIKWRQEDLIPDPLHDRPGRGRGMGRVEAQWPRIVLDQVEEICRLRQQKFRFDAIALELWVSGFNIPTERVRRGLIAEWTRFLWLFETQVFRLQEKLKEGDDSEQRAMDRLARKVARRRPQFANLPRQEQRATVAAWRQMIAPMIFGVDRTAEKPDGKRLTMTLGLPEEFAALVQESQEARWLSGTLNEKALDEPLKDPAKATDLLERILPQARFLRFIAELPESITDVPTDWARNLRFMKRVASVAPRSFGVGMLVIKMFRGGEDPELSNVAATIKAMVQEVSRASPLLAAQLMSAAQKIIPPVASAATKEGR